jgi:hypothetical protein
MSPRINPRFYVLRLAWLGKRTALAALPVGRRPASSREFRGRWPRPSSLRWRT